MPENTYGQIASRSSLPLKHKIYVTTGILDSDYRGPIGVTIYNNSEITYRIRPNIAIAQLLFIPLKTLPTTEVKALTPSERGDKAYGSTDAKALAATVLELQPIKG